MNDSHNLPRKFIRSDLNSTKSASSKGSFYKGPGAPHGINGSASTPRRSVSQGKWLIFIGCVFLNLIVLFGLLANTNEPLVNEFYVCLSVYVVCLLLCFLVHPLKDILEPFHIVLLLYSLYAWSAIGDVVLVGSETFDSSVLWTYYEAIFAGLLGFTIGYMVVRKRKKRSLLVSLTHAENHLFGGRLLGLAILLTLLAVPIISSDDFIIRSYSSATLEGKVSRRFDTGGTAGIATYIKQLLLTTWFGVLVFTAWRSKVMYFFVVSIQLILITLFVMAGSKAELLFISLLWLMYRHYRVRSLPLKQLILPVILCYVFAAMINHVRFTSNIPTMVIAGANFVKEDPKLLSPVNIGELNGPPKTLLTIIEAMEKGELGLSWGYTYLSEALVWLPRFVYPERPIPLSEQYMMRFFPAEYLQGQGYGFFILNEGYWAFGLLGVCLQMFVYGAALSALYGFFRENKGNDGIFLIYVTVFFVLGCTGIRTGLVGGLKASLMAAFPFLVALALSQSRTVKNRFAKSSLPGPVMQEGRPLGRS